MSIHQATEVREFQLNDLSEPRNRPLLGIAPLERFLAPPGLDGRDGKHRGVGTCHIEVNDDLGAIEWWVWKTSKNERTAQQRRAVMDKLVNWACLVRRKAVSSLDEEDFLAFSRFLARPEPQSDWISNCKCRGSPTWRPFTRGLSGTSHAAALVQTRALVSWLSKQNYAQLRFNYSKRAMDDGIATVAVRGANLPVKLVEPLSVAEWHWIRRALDQHFPAIGVSPQRLVVELLYYGNLNCEEVARLELCDFEAPSRTAPGWMVRVRGRSWARGGPLVLAPPPLGETIARWMALHEVPRKGFVTLRIRTANDLMLGPEAPRAALLGRQVLRLAASLALSAADFASGMRLRDQPLTNLRSAFALHQLRSPDGHVAAALTGDGLTVDFDSIQPAPANWDWSAAEHLWNAGDGAGRP
jgi:hypothetical protein